MIAGGLVLPVGLSAYGWSATAHVHPAVLIFATGTCGFGPTATTIPANTYVVAAFEVHAASALAAMTVLTCAAGAVMPLAGPPLYEALGLGWGNPALGSVALGLVPMPVLLTKFGESMRRWVVQN